MDRAHRWIVDLIGGSPPPLGDDRTVRKVEELLAGHGLGAMAVAAHRRGPPLLPPATVTRFEAAYRRTALWTDLLVESGGRARGVLADAGVEALLFKGAGLVSDGTWSDPGARPMDDADLLVPTGSAERAVRVLVDAGWLPWEPWSAGRPGWADSFSLTDSASPPGMPLALDLHWRTGYGRLRFGSPGESPLWEGASAGVPAPAPHLVLIAEHALKHLRRRVHLPALADVARLAPRVGDWDRVAAAVAVSPLSAGVVRLLEGLRHEAGVPVPDGLFGERVMRRRRGGPLDPSSLVARSSPPGTRVGGLLLRWRLLGSAGAVARDVLHAAFPGAPWLRARYGRASGRGWVAGLWIRYVLEALRWSVALGPSPASPNQGLTGGRSDTEAA